MVQCEDKRIRTPSGWTKNLEKNVPVVMILTEYINGEKVIRGYLHQTIRYLVTIKRIRHVLD